MSKLFQKFRFNVDLTKMNDLIDANRTHWSVGAKIKEDETLWVKLMAHEQRLKPFTQPVRIKWFWKYQHRGQDPDNIASQKKQILDGLKAAGVLPKDNLTFVVGFDGDEFCKSEDYGGEVHIYEI